MTYKEIFETMAKEIRAFDKSEAKLSLEQMANTLTNVNSTVQEGKDHQNETGRNLVEKYPVLPIGEAADLTLADVLNNWVMYAAHYLQQTVFMIELSSRMQTINGEFDSDYGNEETPIDPYLEAHDKIINDMLAAYTAAMERAATIPEQAIMANLADTIRTIPIVFYAELAQGLQQSITEIDMLSFSNLTIKDTAFQEAVTNYCETAVTKLADSYTAIANMGGSVPETEKQKLENLPAAIESIPVGVEVKIASGTKSTALMGTATVECGFKPDVVVLTGYTVSYGSSYNMEYQLSFCFDAALHEGENSYYLAAQAGSSEYSNGISAIFGRSDTGFSIELITLDTQQHLGNKQFTYTAIKYTE